MKISTRLTRLRKERFLTQTQIAEVIGKKRCTYAAYEENRCEPSLSTLLKLCAYYGISIEEILQSKELVKVI